MNTFSVSQSAARRFLVDTQGLLPHNKTQNDDPENPKEVLNMIQQLECVQIDPVSVVQRNQHLVLAARIPGYQPEYLDQLLSKGKVFEYKANEECIIPIEDYPIFEPVRDRMKNQVKPSLEDLKPVVKAIINRLKIEGPLPSRAFKSENRVHGYWDNKFPKTKETSHALNLLLDAGMIRVVHRKGTERFFHLTEQTIPKKALDRTKTIDMPTARQALIDKYIRAYRLFDAGDPRFGWQKTTASERRTEMERRVQNGTVIPLEIENVKRQYFILAEDLGKLREIAETSHKELTVMEGPIYFLPPLDNLLWRRDRIADLFHFHYRWEIYTPRAKRRYGPYAMPILYGDRLIGRIDPQLDRKENQLRIKLLQFEPSVNPIPRLRDQIHDAIESFATFLNVQKTIVERTEPVGLKI